MPSPLHGRSAAPSVCRAPVGVAGRLRVKSSIRERTHTVQQFIVSYGYLAVFILMLAESACIPVPSELTMVFAGALAAGAVAGAHLNLILVIAAGVAGNVAGSYLAWGIGIYGGRAAWHRWGRYILLRDDDIDRAERWFGRHGTKAVFFGRLLPVVRTFISLPAGLARMPAG